MRDGLYHLVVRTPQGQFRAVAHLAGRKIWGGDAEVHFLGTYGFSGEELTVVLNTDRHSRSGEVPFIFEPDRTELNLQGSWDSDTAHLHGVATTAHGPEVEVTADLRFLAD